MSMYDWAKREVEIAKKHADDKNEGFDYVGACYDSALRAYKVLCDDGHSGLSFSITASILKRFLSTQPLTPIYDEDDVWNLVGGKDSDDYKVYQCKRMSGLFKHVCDDGHVEYTDVNRVTCYEISNPEWSFYSGLATKWFDKNYPIKLPYIGEKINVYIEEFLTDEKNGDFDTVGILFAIKDDEELRINKYYKFDEGDIDWVELTQAQYYKRMFKRIDKE